MENPLRDPRQPLYDRDDRDGKERDKREADRKGWQHFWLETERLLLSPAYRSLFVNKKNV